MACWLVTAMSILFIVLCQIVLVSDPQRRRPDTTGKVPALGKRILDGRWIPCRLLNKRGLLLRLRADTHVVEHPEDSGGEHPCFHDSFPNVPSPLSTGPGEFP